MSTTRSLLDAWAPLRDLFRMLPSAKIARGNRRKPGHLTVAAVQMTFRPTVEANLAAMVAQIGILAQRGVDAVLFPECAVTGYHVDFSQVRRTEVESALDALAAAARTHQIHVLVGSPTYTGRRCFNSLVVFDRRGREIFRYSKIHLTARDAIRFTPGNCLAFFKLEDIPCTAILCHERRFPELVRLPVMLGAQIIFHPNAGLDSLNVSRAKRRGRDGIAVRAFENQAYYVFANSVGPQGDNLWSAGDSKIVGADGRTLALADNRRDAAIHAELDLSLAGRTYAREALMHPVFLRRHWKTMLAAVRRQLDSA